MIQSKEKENIMKKLFALSIIIILFQSIVILKQQKEQKTIQKERLFEILEKIKLYETQYTNQNETTIKYTVNEPPEFHNQNIIKRIKILNDHLDSNPSKNWIKNVLKEAEIIISKSN